jgi:hypothetical protein
MAAAADAAVISFFQGRSQGPRIQIPGKYNLSTASRRFGSRLMLSRKI